MLRALGAGNVLQKGIAALPRDEYKREAGKAGKL